MRVRVCNHRRCHAPSTCTDILPITLKYVKLSGWITNRRRHAPSPRAHIPPVALVSVISLLNMGLHQYISGNATWLFRLFRLTYFSYFRYFSRYLRVIWKYQNEFMKIKKFNDELINIGSCRGPPAMPSRTTSGSRRHCSEIGRAD